MAAVLKTADVKASVGSNPTLSVKLVTLMFLQYFYLSILFIIVFVLFEDPNVPKYIELRLKLFRIDIIKYFMKIKLKRQLDKDQKEFEKWRKSNGKDQM